MGKVINTVVVVLATIGVFALILTFILGADNSQDLQTSTTPVVAVQNHIEYTPKVVDGRLQITSTDAEYGYAIKGAEYLITDLNTFKIVDNVVSDENGVVTSQPLPYGDYLVQLKKIKSPYPYIKSQSYVSIAQEMIELEFFYELPEYIQDHQYTDQGEIEITEVFIPVPSVFQLPELPNGCEITSATAVLQYYNYPVSKTVMADEYLPQVPFSYKNNVRYGPDPYIAYAGNPRLQPGGFFSYAPPIVEAVQLYVEDKEVKVYAKDISGSSKEEILKHLDRGVPVVIWVTLDLSKPKLTSSWHFVDSDEKFIAPVNLHCVVLNGYDVENVFVMDPLKGNVVRDMEAFFSSYDDLGSHALIIE